MSGANLFGYGFVGFLLAIAILVTIHELGHYLVARWCGVKVLRFSIGFGPVILKWVGKRSIFKGTEFALSAIPLGGYVRMLDTRDPACIPKNAEEVHLAFNKQTLAKRALIVAAGPLANFMLAAVLYVMALSIPDKGPAAYLAPPPAGSAAYEAGLRGGERVTQINGQSIAHWDDVQWGLMVNMFSTDMTLTLDNAGVSKTAELHRAAASDDAVVNAPEKRLVSWGLGIDLPPLVGQVSANSPAEHAGFRAGDKVLRVNAVSVGQWTDFTRFIQKSANQPIIVSVLRNDAPVELAATPRAETVNGQIIGRLGVAIQNPRLATDRLVEHRRSLFEAASDGIERAAQATLLTVRAMWAMVTGELSLKQVSGPVAMAEGAGVTLSLGFVPFILFLAIVSISIGVLNLLPVPMLDGGQLLYHLIEALKGSPLSERAEAVGQRIGIGFVLALTSLALYNDFLRIIS